MERGNDLWHLVAADLPTKLPTDQASDNTTAYLTFFGGIIATLGLIAVAYINSRKEKTSPSPPPPVDPSQVGTTELRIQVGVNAAKIEAVEKDTDELAETVDLIDRRAARGEIRQENLDGRVTRTEAEVRLITRFLDHEHPGWSGNDP